MGAALELAPVFRRRYGGWLRVPTMVERELRGISEIDLDRQPPPEDLDRERRLRDNAKAAVQTFFLGGSALKAIPVPKALLTKYDEIRRLLEDRSGKGGNEGEAAAITLAVYEGGRTESQSSAFLTNDGPASRLAYEKGIVAWTFPETIADLHRFDSSVTASMCWEHYGASSTISKPPTNAIPPEEAWFRCREDEPECKPCREATALDQASRQL